MSLALATGQPFSEVLDWSDQDIATAHALLEELHDRM